MLQVPRILNPVMLVLDALPKLGRDPNIAAYLTACFGGVEATRRVILTDFCRHAFDGSGADNFFDAGSCIDGRLTSAWNWCSKVRHGGATRGDFRKAVVTSTRAWLWCSKVVVYSLGREVSPAYLHSSKSSLLLSGTLNPPFPPPRALQLEKKPYYPVFKLAGFTGFDGDFK